MINAGARDGGRSVPGPGASGPLSLQRKLPGPAGPPRQRTRPESPGAASATARVSAPPQGHVAAPGVRCLGREMGIAVAASCDRGQDAAHEMLRRAEAPRAERTSTRGASADCQDPADATRISHVRRGASGPWAGAGHWQRAC